MSCASHCFTDTCTETVCVALRDCGKGTCEKIPFSQGVCKFLHLIVLMLTNFDYIQHSWTNFIYTRCQNINRKSKNPQSDQDEGSRASKKSKIAPEKHSYPSLTMDEDDDVAFERNVSLMKHELGKQKLQSASIFSLMERTFTRRRQCMLDDCKSVKEICEKYPCLSKSIYVSYYVYTCNHLVCIFLSFCSNLDCL